MKKYCVILFLPVLFILAFVNANLFFIQKTGDSSLSTASTNTFFNTNFNYPESEIENTATFGHTVLHANQGLQKIPGYLPGNARAAVISPVFSSLKVAPAVELFDNNYLSHNYPSHNFW